MPSPTPPAPSTGESSAGRELPKGFFPKSAASWKKAWTLGLAAAALDAALKEPLPAAKNPFDRPAKNPLAQPAKNPFA